jgi:NTP pyrophosphatase (non-canonical NTP hydrolase)
MYEKESLLREHAKEITEIIEATREDPENEEIRAEIADALSDSLNKKKMRARSVKDTDLYRLAQAVKQAGDQQECAELVKRAFPRRWSIIFEKYNFDWKFSCKEMKPTRRKEPAKKMAEGPINGIEEEVQGLERTIKELDEHVGELTKEIRKHEEK